VQTFIAFPAGIADAAAAVSTSTRPWVRGRWTLCLRMQARSWARGGIRTRGWRSGFIAFNLVVEIAIVLGVVWFGVVAPESRKRGEGGLGMDWPVKFFARRTLFRSPKHEMK